jgi:hypothetical protein
MRNILILFVFLFSSTSFSAEILPALGTSASLERPAGKPRGSIILMPGGNGNLGIESDGEITQSRSSSLIRNRKAFARAGYATLSLDANGSLFSAITAMRGIAEPIIVVGTSRAATRMQSAVSADAIVLTSAMLDHFQWGVGSPEALPPTLVVHHRNDSCRVTLPGLVEPFQQWGAGRVRVVWLAGGRDDGDPCKAGGYHGFKGIDGQMVSAIIRFAGGIRRR